MSTEKQLGDYYVCHHMKVEDIDSRPDVVRNPVDESSTEYTHVGHRDKHMVRIQSRGDNPKHVYECPDCGKQRSVCPVCKGQGRFKSDDGDLVYCHNCSPEAAREQAKESRRR